MVWSAFLRMPGWANSPMRPSTWASVTMRKVVGRVGAGIQLESQPMDTHTARFTTTLDNALSTRRIYEDHTIRAAWSDFGARRGTELSLAMWRGERVDVELPVHDR